MEMIPTFASHSAHRAMLMRENAPRSIAAVLRHPEAIPEKVKIKLPTLEQTRVAVIGLGYVGLPLAVEFGKVFPTIGLDINMRRVEELKEGRDSTLEVSSEQLREATRVQFTSLPAEARQANVFIVAVPTPVDKYKRPDLTPLLQASECAGKLLKPGDVVVYESTVYPGATEEECVPILEQRSGLQYNYEFFVGYSPERVNPGDNEHRVSTTKKVTSGSTAEAAAFVDAIYKSIVVAGTHCAPSIRVAEAAKVIENTQRDINIALINELAIIFNIMGIDTEAVLAAAGTKWNFLPFRPGLVGGHCIGVDPYYLTHKAQALGYHPEIILAGRRLNDNMGCYVATNLVRRMSAFGMRIDQARVLIMGLTFKENCPDIRNTRVVDVVRELRAWGLTVDVYDPWASADEARSEYQIDLLTAPQSAIYDAIVLAVAHDRFRAMGRDGIRRLGRAERHVVYDLKYVLPEDASDMRL
jgi:UDP-N-acetyl-D-glucosamine/UDP-N-acetyl-D-galactosamine dehydrogenase